MQEPESFPIISPELAAKIVHWTQLKAARLKCLPEMLEPGGCCRTQSAQLATDNIKDGLPTKVYLVHFDASYLKFQIASLLSAVMEDAINGEKIVTIEQIQNLVLDAIFDFESVLEESETPKQAVAALRAKYAP